MPCWRSCPKKWTISCWRRKTSAGWFQIICSFSSSAKGICIWLEVEFIQLCSLSCHSYSQCSEPGQKKVILLQKAFHTLKPVKAKTCELYSQTDSLMHYLVSWANDQSKGCLAEMKVNKGAEGKSDSRSTLLFGIIPRRIIWPEYKSLKRHFQQWHTMANPCFVFFFTCPRALSREKYCQGSYSLAIPKTTGNQLSQCVQLIKNCEYQCSFLRA